MDNRLKSCFLFFISFFLVVTLNISATLGTGWILAGNASTFQSIPEVFSPCLINRHFTQIYTIRTGVLTSLINPIKKPNKIFLWAREE